MHSPFALDSEGMYLSNATELRSLTVCDSPTIKCLATGLNITGPPKCPSKQLPVCHGNER